MPRAAWIAALVLLAAGVAASFLPFMAEDRPALAGTPVPPPLIGRHTVVPVEPGDEVCWDSLAISPDADAVGFAVGTYFRRGQPLELALYGPGFADSARVAGGYRDNSVVEFDISPPPQDVLAGACVTNTGTRKVGLYATDSEHEAARPTSTIAGQDTRIDPAFVLLENEKSSLVSRIPDALDRAGLFAPLGWLAWPLLALALLAIPTLALLVLRDAWRD